MYFEILEMLKQEDDKFYSTSELYSLYIIHYGHRPNRNNFLASLRKLWLRGKLERIEEFKERRIIKYRLLPIYREIHINNYNFSNNENGNEQQIKSSC